MNPESRVPRAQHFGGPLNSPLHSNTTRPHAHTYVLHFKDTVTGFYMGYNLLETPVFYSDFKLKICDPQPQPMITSE